MNYIHDNDKCFKYTTTVALNHEETGKDLRRISKIKHFISKYNWKGMNYPSGKMTGKSLRKIIY